MLLKKKPIVETDLVLIHIEDKPAFYGRVEKIIPDIKPKWWRVKFLFLTFPYQITTWIIDHEQIRGGDFTMAGTPIRIEKIVLPADESHAVDRKSVDSVAEEKTGKKASVLSLGQKRKN